LTTQPPRSSAQTTARREEGFACLHGLRGVLALWVVLYHTSNAATGPLHVIRYGYLAVDMFFVMSGFILLHTHRADCRTLGARAALHFWSLRLWRTYPVNIAAFLLSVGITLAIAHTLPDATTLADALLFLNTWIIPVADHAANGALWSLKIEWWGYFAFPLLCPLVIRLSPRNAILVLAPAIMLGEVALFSFGVGGLQFDNQGFDRQLLRMASGFGLGCVLRVGFDHQLVRRMRGDGLMVAMIAAALVVLLIGDPSLSLPFLAVIVVTACRPGALTRLLLANPVALWLGRLSFSIYMVHFPIMVLFGYVQHRAGGAVPGWASTLATLLATCVAASLICRWIEEPARRFGRRLTDARLPLAPAAQNS